MDFNILYVGFDILYVDFNTQYVDLNTLYVDCYILSVILSITMGISNDDAFGDVHAELTVHHACAPQVLGQTVLGQKLLELPEGALRHEIDLHDDLDVIEVVRHALQLECVGLPAYTPTVGDLEHLLRREALKCKPKVNIRDAVDEDHRVESFFPKATVLGGAWCEDRLLIRVVLLRLRPPPSSRQAAGLLDDGPLLDVVVGQGATILRLLAREHQAEAIIVPQVLYK